MRSLLGTWRAAGAYFCGWGRTALTRTGCKKATLGGQKANKPDFLPLNPKKIYTFALPGEKHAGGRRRSPLPRTAAPAMPSGSQTQAEEDMTENYSLSHLKELEAESIYIIREVAAEFENPVMLYSIGKDSSVMVRLAEKAFAPGKVPFPLMHIDSKWKFKEMITFRDSYAKQYGWNLIVESNMEAFNAGVGPFTHGSKVHTDLMKTKALLDALDKHKFDAAFGGARRDEEKSRAKERIFSFRDQFHQWDPKNQRPELWDIYNARVRKGESIRVFPLSNWTELDIWQYIRLENIPIVPLYFAKERPVVNLDGQLIMPDDDRLPQEYRDRIEMKKIRFRTLGCWPLTGAIESEADTIEKIVEEMMTTTKSERTTRVIDFDQEASMEQKKREGYF